MVSTLSHLAMKFQQFSLTTLTFVACLSFALTCCSGGGGGGSATEDTEKPATNNDAPAKLIPDESQNNSCTFTINTVSDSDFNEYTVIFECGRGGIISDCTICSKDKSVQVSSSTGSGRWEQNAATSGSTMNDLSFNYSNGTSNNAFEVQIMIDSLSISDIEKDSDGNPLRFSAAINSARSLLRIEGVTSDERSMRLNSAVEAKYH